VSIDLVFVTFGFSPHSDVSAP